MKAAIIQENIVINVIEIEQKNWDSYAALIPETQTLIASDIAAIGDIYNPQDGSFTKPVSGEQ